MINLTKTESLRCARIERDMKLRDVSKLLGTTANTLSCWENGTKAIPLVAVLKLARIYDKSLDSFDFSKLESTVYRNHRFVEENIND